MKQRILLLGIGVAIVLGLLYMYFGGKGSKQGFQNPSMDTFTMYYADWCGHCQKAKPEFKEFAAAGSVLLTNGLPCKIRMIEADSNKEEIAAKKVQGFPTFLLETTDGKVVEYKGKRSTDGYLKFINETLGMKGDVA
jgi:thiol-disulfide isomerase/thioredoxin